jgi:hypothetical protein
MGFTEEQLRLASAIDVEFHRLAAAGTDEVGILRDMFEYMPNFKRLMDTAKPGDMDRLCERFEGFHHYAKILENLAGGIRSGKLKVPR